MSDEVAKRFEEEPKPAPESNGRSYSITVTLHPNQSLELSGPLGNKVLANGLLQAGLQELHRIHLMKELEVIAKAQAARGGLNGLLKKATGG